MVVSSFPLRPPLLSTISYRLSCLFALFTLEVAVLAARPFARAFRISLGAAIARCAQILSRFVGLTLGLLWPAQASEPLVA